MNTRRKFLVQGGMAATALLATRPLKAFAQLSQPVSYSPGAGNSILLLHTHNLFSGNTTAPDGAALSQLKSRYPHAVLLDVGHGGSTSHQDPASCCDALLPDHKHFEKGLSQAPFSKPGAPIIVSNYEMSNEELHKGVQPYRIIQKGKIRIGIIGAATHPGTLQGIGYKNPIKQISHQATALKERHGCHLVVCLSNLGYKHSKRLDDQALAHHSRNVDVIIGAHAHSSLRHPSIVLNKYQQEVIINHAGTDNIALGQIEIHFDENGKKNRISFNNRTTSADLYSA